MMDPAAHNVEDFGALLFAQETSDDPHQNYGVLRERCPVHVASFEASQAAYLFTYEDIAFALRHPEIFSSVSDVASMGQEQPLIPLQVDPPLHTRYRRLLNPPFTPKRIAELESDVRRLVVQLLDGFAGSGACDFHEQFATPLPSTIFLRLMGLPQSDLPFFLEYRDDIIRPAVAPGDFEGAAAVRAAAGKRMNEYFETAIEVARRDGAPGLLGELVHAEMEGRPLTQVELLGICNLMLLGGLDTVTATLDCMVAYLARHPDRRQALIDDPSLLPAAIEEMLRHQTPVTMVPRMVRERVELSGVVLEPGTSVLLVLGAANADEHAFVHAADTDFGRTPNRHVAFGDGNHLCIGAHLARLEIRVALEELHRRVPNYRIPDGEEIHFSPGIRQADHLPLTWP